MTEKSTELMLAQDANTSAEAQHVRDRPANKMLWLVLLIQFLLMLCIAAAAVYFYRSLDDTIQEQDTSLSSAQAKTRQELQEIQASQQNLKSDIAQISDATLNDLDKQLSSALERFDGIEQSVEKINSRLTDLSPRDEQQWMISQIEYFLKMAQYRLTLTGDNQGAALLLDQAAAVAAQLRSPDAQSLLAALSEDRADIKIDGFWQPELIHAQLNALIETIPKLSLAAYEATDFEVDTGKDDFSAEGINKLLGKLVRVQTTDQSVKPLLDQTTRKQVEQHMFMLLTEAQLNVMRQNQKGYISTLKQLDTLVSEAFNTNQKETQFFLAEIDRLQEVEITKPTGSLDSSQQALRNLIRIFEQKNG